MSGTRAGAPQSSSAASGSGSGPGRYRRPQERRSQPQRWRAAVDTLVQLQAHYEDWLERLPASLHGTPLGAKLQAICELDLEDLQSVEPPLGFGRAGARGRRTR